ncbi:hypothetical protein A3D84_03695 [Candidatus Woesebacteria bacterium RIFCSPHIGHO2_02_FULL_42_20]|uniref:HTH cro/C1-type domain-containing protein n=1 Tax=Candidatus Woesebacteria bacterium RIFCSPHIGHO2_12_FULL_41_24 TaxID=1802510 RepID=A0A1F8AVG6_9BACT|nr:MAG: hypothetical protein A2W15_03845 [Candidatus Woesebacteria bacterium RBG_16_41_13]OGM29160.1 MAG: hypothetical protein A2873_01470 [Candidatus Woesebacteria bacterium RIFCSPHIGHO2_01_FULL_42_80]OGM35637.1 MAG: hypothetical protein A3D84_03695 [Candidatus Woesebacteria bacterium RIFCSPHIGHO2_02_FULL_42_20]OGM55248.1 MAG: hypothetical protein A3E44_03105 [Candidatus Woesebacteria bacterium RIFCSPHIGHO2_12_FULL_41_24]OGM67202.1 MAG: hypothetical protein A2969_04830 [Candidatus Woesebacteri
MRTIGQVLKDARIIKGLDLASLAKTTKIKTTFLVSIEKENWNKLPEYPVVVGFVKTLGKFLEVGEGQAVALLRRDYPPKVLSVNPKPDVENKFIWNPKKSFLTGILVVFVFVAGYLLFQYTRFANPPVLRITDPIENFVTSGATITVSGVTNPTSAVRVNNQPVIVGDDGQFETQLDVLPGEFKITIRSVSRSGKETVVERVIKVED